MVKKTTASNKFHRKKLRRIIQDGVERSPPPGRLLFNFNKQNQQQ